MKLATIMRSSLLLLGVLAYAHIGLAQQVPSDKEAQRILHNAKPLAEQGNANAQYNLGVLYDEGYGVDRDYAKAMKWYKKAAHQAYGKAEHNLGIMYQEGHGVQANASKASHWFQRAAEHGEPAAQNNLAVMYVRGQGVPQDLGKAGYWVARAAKAGNKSAITNLPHIADNLPSAKVKGNSVNIRKQPNKNAEVVRQASNGQQVRVLDHKNKWTQVLFPDAYAVGWVADFLLAQNSGSRQGTRKAQSAAANGSSKNKRESKTSSSQGSGQANNQAADNASVEGKQSTQGGRARIKGDVVNIRARATTKAGVVMQAHNGQKVTIIGRKDDWRHVRFDSGRSGWVASFLLSGGGSGSSESSSGRSASSGPQKHIGGDNVNIRKRPSTSAGVAFQADRNDTVTVIGKHDDWRHVRFADGRTGWVAGFLLTR